MKRFTNACSFLRFCITRQPSLFCFTKHSKLTSTKFKIFLFNSVLTNKSSKLVQVCVPVESEKFFQMGIKNLSTVVAKKGEFFGNDFERNFFKVATAAFMCFLRVSPASNGCSFQFWSSILQNSQIETLAFQLLTQQTSTSRGFLPLRLTL